MAEQGLAWRNRNVPRPSCPQLASEGIEAWLHSLGERCDRDTHATGRAFASASEGYRLLSGVLGNSRFLTLCAVKDPAFALELFMSGPDSCLVSAKDDFFALYDKVADRDDLARDLRRAKQRAALMIAVADITGIWNVQKVTATLSDIAETALRCACAYGLRLLASRGVITLPSLDRPETNSGLIVLGMGKLGARELNYSSDIDIIIFYDEERIQTDEPERLQRHFVRIARDVLYMLDQRTADGYVFRTDLRLRPDPASTPIASSVRSGLTYYAQRGRDWERAAMIKARAVAGDIDAGERFLARLTSFVWQKNLDFTAIGQIRNIKRQINLHKGGGEIAISGHNIKLGRGGIREVEFFAQAQQLVWAGRFPALRCRSTIDALKKLVAANLLPASRADALTTAYYFLRRIEHRLQMVNDEQTHSLPIDRDEFVHLSTFLGYGNQQEFEQTLLHHLRFVDGLFIQLFEVSLLPVDKLGDSGAVGGAHPSRQTGDLGAMPQLGLPDPLSVQEAVGSWVCSGEREARELSKDLAPILLKAFARLPRPDRGFRQFEKLLSDISNDVPILSMLHANPHLVGMLVNLIEKAPNLVDHLARHPSALEAVLAQDFFDPVADQEALDQKITNQVAHSGPFEEYLYESRRWVNDHRFQVAVHLLGGMIEPRVAATGLSGIAQALVRAGVPRIAAEVDEVYGRIADIGLAVVDCGDLASREMLWHSRPDFVFVYDISSVDGGEGSVGFADLGACTAKLYRHLMDILTGPQVGSDVKLPQEEGSSEGGGRPPCWCLESFRSRFSSSTPVSELLTLVRTRVVAGAPRVGQRVEDAVLGALTLPRDRSWLRKSIDHYRAQSDPRNGTGDVWAAAELRRQADKLELTAQLLQLWFAERHPEVLDPHSGQAFARLRDKGLLSHHEANDLIAARGLLRGVLGLVEVAVTEESTASSEVRVFDALKPRLAQIMDVPDFQSGTELLFETIEGVDRHVDAMFRAL